MDPFLVLNAVVRLDPKWPENRPRFGIAEVRSYSSMIPDATTKLGGRAGLVTTLGFAVAAALSGLNA